MPGVDKLHIVLSVCFCFPLFVIFGGPTV